jgi:hypothetical protein
MIFIISDWKIGGDITECHQEWNPILIIHVYIRLHLSNSIMRTTCVTGAWHLKGRVALWVLVDGIHLGDEYLFGEEAKACRTRLIRIENV